LGSKPKIIFSSSKEEEFIGKSKPSKVIEVLIEKALLKKKRESILIEIYMTKHDVKTLTLKLSLGSSQFRSKRKKSF